MAKKTKPRLSHSKLSIFKIVKHSKMIVPYGALVIAHIIWGGTFVVAKVTLQEIPTMSLAFIRFFSAFLLMLPFLLSLEKTHRKIKNEHAPKLFLIGILMVTFHIALFFEGLKRTTSIDASVLAMATPVLSVLAGWWFLKEKIFSINLVGIFFSLTGALLIFGIPLLFLGSFQSAHAFGNLLLLLSVVSYVAGVLLSKEMLSKYPPLVVTAVIFFVGAVTFLIPAIFEYLANPAWVSQVTIVGILGSLYLIFLSTVCAYFFINWALERIDVVKVNLFHYLEPAVAATIAVPLLGERISFSFIIGTCLIILGVYWGTLGRQHHHHPHHNSHRV